ncbi:MAG: phosphatase PAP2 family protein [Candidatus Omnitrophica bacterium]|nr:phosphatase PAP2 family protein [Candidatus Omnitrophota bacterium]
MLTLDNILFYLINKNCQSSFLDIFMPLLTIAGRADFLFIAGAIFILKKKGTLKSIIFLLFSLVISIIVVYILKSAYALPRPFLILPDVHLLVKEKGFSFPSGHATNVFMVAALLSAYSKRYRIFYAVAFLVAFSRVYIGVHYPSDVLSGALLGMILGYGLAIVSKKIFQAKS